MLRISKNFLAILAIASFFSLLSCNRIIQPEKGKTNDGNEYAIFRTGDNTRFVGEEDFVDFHLVILNAKDSILKNTYDKQIGERMIEGAPMKELQKYNEAVFKTLFKKLTVGDSAVFKVKTEYEFAEFQKNMKTQIASAKEYVNTNAKDTSKAKKMELQELQKNIEKAEASMGKPDKNYPAGKFFTYKVKMMRVESKTEREKRMKDDIASREKGMQEQSKKAEKQENIDIEAYIKKNNLKPIKTASGLQYVITKEGKGDRPKAGDEVSVNYAGRLANGKLFDTSIESVAKEAGMLQPNRQYAPYKFPLGVQQVIPGWDEGLALLNKGAKAIFLIPHRLGYGMQGKGDIPPGAPLFFEVELVDFQAQKK